MIDTVEPQVAGTQDHHFFDLLIRDDPQLERMMLDEHDPLSIIQKLLLVSVIGAGLYGFAVGLAAQFLDVTGCIVTWLGGMPVFTVPSALVGAFLVAQIVCMPSFYFYTQLSGLNASLHLITAQSLRVQARTSILLLGVLPIYAAIVLAAIVGRADIGAGLILSGLLLPFVVGFAGVVSLYRSFASLVDILPVSHTRRPQFLLRMVVAWCAVYSAVCPVALYRLGEALSF